MTKVLITGGTGFVGTRVIERLLLETDWDVYSIERLPSRRNALGGMSESARIHRIYHDLLVPLPRDYPELEGIDYFIHAGCEVSGIRSLTSPVNAVESSVLGTYHLLELARLIKPNRFLYVSSAEAVGAVPYPVSLAEDAPLNPSNPYAAAKAAAEALIRSYSLSFGVPSIIVRSMNLFGPRQGIDRFLPRVIANVAGSRKVICHAAPDGTVGSRHWLHIDEFTDELLWLMIAGKRGEVYHAVGPERTNTQIIEVVEKALGEVAHVEYDVPGPSHDLRYSVKDTKLGVKLGQQLEEDIYSTVRWYGRNTEWLDG